jgi:methylmalonyl-CoA mutase
MNDLFAEFEPTTYADWEQLLAKALKGKSLDSLDWQFDEHLRLKPLYRTAQNAEPIYSSKSANWAIGERFEWTAQDLAGEKSTFLQALQNGAQVAEIHLHPAAIPHLGHYLEGVWLDMIDINWCFAQLADFDLFLNFCKKNGLNLQIKGCFLFENLTLEAQFTLYQQHKNDFPKVCFFNIAIDSSSEGSRAEKLAQMLLSIYKVYQFLGTMQQVSAELRLGWSVGASFWIEIAQIRAVKKLWVALCQSLDEHTSYPSIQAETQTCISENEHYNQIVAAAQGLSAAIGRVDVLTVCPRGGWANVSEQARRLARNIQHILIEECHINAIADAAAGSFYLENATQQLIENAWALFRKKIEN